MSHSQFRHIELILRHAWLNLQEESICYWQDQPDCYHFGWKVHQKGQRSISRTGLPGGGLSMPVLLATSSVARLNARGRLRLAKGRIGPPRRPITGQMGGAYAFVIVPLRSVSVQRLLYQGCPWPKDSQSWVILS